MNFDYTELAAALGPETSLTVGALAILGADLTLFRRAKDTTRFHAALALGALAVLVALALALRIHVSSTPANGVFAGDALAAATRSGALALALVALGLGATSRIPNHPAEYVALLLFATTGITLMAAAQHLLVAFLAIELTGLAFYPLVAFNLSRRESAEAALKYFLFGGISAAFLLFGFSLLYGLTGALDLAGVASGLAHTPASPLCAVALVMIVVALGYKTAAAPFHLWAPDAYQGAPTPVAALIASGSKLGGLVMFTRLLWPTVVIGAAGANGFHVSATWLPTVGVVAGISMVLGNVAALAQSNVRRLLAYSAIAHAGSLLLGVMTVGSAGPAPLYYYALTYGLATAGAFGVLAAMERAGEVQTLSDLAGLAKRSPLLASCLLVFVLSLAGIPPLAGFFGKFFVFAAALKIGGLATIEGALAIAAILLSVVSLYYYLQILKQAWVAAPSENAPPLRVSGIGALTLVAVALALLALGVAPNWILRPIAGG